jgi:hypothetical protein
VLGPLKPALWPWEGKLAWRATSGSAWSAGSYGWEAIYHRASPRQIYRMFRTTMWVD